MCAIYNLGKYRYKDGAIYKQVVLTFYKKIDPGPYSYLQGVSEVNKLCGIASKEKSGTDLQALEEVGLDVVEADNSLCGRFLVNLKNPESFFGNDPLPATICKYNGRLQVIWDNGFECVSDHSDLNIYVLYE